MIKREQVMDAVKELNESGLLVDLVKISRDDKTLIENFMLGCESINDEKELEIPANAVNLYNELVEQITNKLSEEVATPKAATEEVATPKAATEEVATPKAATEEVATPKAATEEVATPKAAPIEISNATISRPKFLALRVKELGGKDVVKIEDLLKDEVLLSKFNGHRSWIRINFNKMA